MVMTVVMLVANNPLVLLRRGRINTTADDKSGSEKKTLTFLKTLLESKHCKL